VQTVVFGRNFSCDARLQNTLRWLCDSVSLHTVNVPIILLVIAINKIACFCR